MELSGIRNIDFRRFTALAESDTDRRERITESLAWHLGEYISGEQGEYDVGVNLVRLTSGDFVFEGQDILDQSFESDEMIDVLWEVRGEVEDRLGFETVLLDDWTVEFREAA